MNEWTELRSLQDVAAAQARGDEIECNGSGLSWSRWIMQDWFESWRYRSRPRKKTKTVVLREYIWNGAGKYGISWSSAEEPPCFNRWTGNERTEEVEE